MRKFSMAALALTLVTLSATTFARQQAPTFRSGVSLATIDVTVLDKDGKPVTGLTADDIEIKLNGKVQPVRALAFVQAAAAPAAPSSAPSKAEPAPAAALSVAASPETPRRTVSNANAPSRAAAAAVVAPAAAPASSPAPPAESRVFVLLVDDLSYSPLRGKALFNAASKFLDRIPASDPVGFSTTSGSGGAINPTRDRAAVRAALAKVVGEFMDPRGIGKSGAATIPGCAGTPDQAVGLGEAIDIDRGDDSLFMEVVARECFNGDRSAVTKMSAGEARGNCGCAHDLDSQARRNAALVRQNKGRQINAIASVITAMKNATGIRHLVLLTEGLPVSREVNDLNPVARSAALSGIQLSVLLEEPDASMADEGRRAQAPNVAAQTDPGEAKRRREDNALLVNGAQTMTNMLGGTFYRVIGDAMPSFDRVITASSAVYRLGVELPSNAQPGKEMTVSASVKRPGVTVLANKFAMMPVADTPAAPAAASKPATLGEPSAANALTTADRVPVSIDDVLKGALNSTTITSDVPMRMALSQRRSANVAGQVDVSLNLAIPSSVKGPIVAFVGLIDSNNAIRSTRKVLDPVAGADYAAPFLFPMAPGDYRIRIAAADASGAVGTVETPISVKLAPFGAFTSSDVLTWIVDASNRAQLFAIEDIPSGVEDLHASIEVYPAGDMPGDFPAVKWSLWREGEAKAIAEEETPARPSATLMRSDVAFPIAALPAGQYTVRAELLMGDKVTGSRAAVVRKR